MLKSAYTEDLIEAGCDEAGRGCLAGPVFAAAVIFKKKFYHRYLNDSKKLSPVQRIEMRNMIREKALAWAVASVSSDEIDEMNILNASFLAMHKAIKALDITPQLLLIDGNRFNPFEQIPHRCIVKGDGLYLSIAAASILAKTYRDEFMADLHREFPVYDWIHNKGYPTEKHRKAIFLHGSSKYHRKSFHLTGQFRFPF